MKAQLRLRRRTRPALLARFRTYWLALLVSGVLVCGAAWLLATSPVFHLATLNVSGLSHVGRGEIVRLAAIDPRANVWFIDRGALERRLAAVPYVASARVHLRPLANVWLDVRERRAEGCVRDAAGNALLIDADLRVLEAGCASAGGVVYKLRAGLDAVPGDFLHERELVALQKDARLLAASGERYHAFAYDRFGQLEAALLDGIAVRFGDDADLKAKAQLVAPILARLGGPAAASVLAIDLRAPGTPVVVYRSADPKAATRTSGRTSSH